MNKLFGTDGVRGVANQYPMDSETVMRLGRAAATVLRRSSGRHSIVIGKDTRVSGYMLETAMASGIASMGVDVLIVGPLPTPGISFTVRSMRADAGVMISASHNPYTDNGIKFFGADGFKLPDETEAEIEALMGPGSLDKLTVKPELVGKASRIEDAIGRYTVYLKSCLPRECKLDGKRVVLDAGHGAAYRVAPLAFRELGAEVITIGDEPDGTNINRGCGSLHPEKLIDKVLEVRADFGFAFDGDADRVVVCDEKGMLLDGDDVLALLATYFKKTGALSSDIVVGTVMTNYGLEVYFNKIGLNLQRAAVGDRYVISDMLKSGSNLGGEQSGHIISLDHNTTGDGVLSALLVCSALVEEKKKMSDYNGLFERCPQNLINVPVSEKRPFEELPGVQSSVNEIEKKLGNKGRVILRYSGTENLARVMVEALDERLCSSCAADLANVVRQEIGA